MIEEMRKTINMLNEWTKAYDEGHPQISDKEWDDKYFQLVEMERSTGVQFNDSPTNKVCYFSVSSLKKAKHTHDMLSLEKTKQIDDLKSFIGGRESLAMCKMDGLTLTLRYENGQLVGAETRGNGEVGEDVLHNAIGIKNIPHVIPYKKTLEVDGEVIIKYNDFEAMTELGFVNPRNAAAGSIRLLNGNESAKRHLTFVAWEVISGFEEYNCLSDRLAEVGKLGFTIVPMTIVKDIDELTVYSLKQEAEKNSYPIDGIVVKYNDIEYGSSLGSTAHHAKNAIAYKFYDDLYDTCLRDIEWSLGKTGSLTPVAIFDPVEIDGTIVQRASLHNVSVMAATLGNCAYKGEPIKVFKANQIIPQVYPAKDEDRKSYQKAVEEGKTVLGQHVKCPVCGAAADLVSLENGTGEEYVCSNPCCKGKIAERLGSILGKKGLDVEGFKTTGSKVLANLVSSNSITGVLDIFNLPESAFVTAAGSEVKGRKIYKSLHSCGQSIELSRVFVALGIDQLGTSAAQKLAQQFHTWDDFVSCSDFSYCNGINAPVVAGLNKMWPFGEMSALISQENFNIINSESEEKTTEGKLKGLRFGITGKFVSIGSRSDVVKLIEQNGGIYYSGSSISSSKVDYLLCGKEKGDAVSSKQIAAQKNNVPCLSEQEFLNKLN